MGAPLGMIGCDLLIALIRLRRAADTGRTRFGSLESSARLVSIFWLLWLCPSSCSGGARPRALVPKGLGSGRGLRAGRVEGNPLLAVGRGRGSGWCSFPTGKPAAVAAGCGKDRGSVSATDNGEGESGIAPAGGKDGDRGAVAGGEDESRVTATDNSSDGSGVVRAGGKDGNGVTVAGAEDVSCVAATDSSESESGVTTAGGKDVERIAVVGGEDRSRVKDAGGDESDVVVEKRSGGKVKGRTTLALGCCA